MNQEPLKHRARHRVESRMKRSALLTHEGTEQRERACLADLCAQKVCEEICVCMNMLFLITAC